MRHRLVQFLILTALFLCACDAKRPRAYITPVLRLNKTSVPMGTPVYVTYRFQTSKGFAGLKKDLIVFVHFIDPSGKIRFV